MENKVIAENTAINKENRALIAMSGGVDSSVAACLMKEQGYDCVGVTMKLFQNEDVGVSKEHSCCSLDDVEDARSVARELEMPYYVMNFAEKFKEKVIEPFVDAYEHGRTPNPCIDCNRFLKFEKLYHRAQELDCEYVVTGHYAQIVKDEETGRFLLKKAVDDTKDQSYVLYALTQDQLAHTKFPLGGMRKTEARDIAERHYFVNARKSDSQDICFVQDGDYAKFIEEFTGKQYPTGDFVDLDGNVLGTHKGIIHYTIGQRKGLGIAFGCPMYVSKVDAVNNKVTLGTNESLFTKEIIAKDINLIAYDKIEGQIRLKAKARYRHKEQWAMVEQLDEDTLHIVYEEPQRAITSGQAVVLYDGDIVVGGGTIQ